MGSIVDDLHWADAGSISLMFHLSRRIRGNRILILGIYRSADVAQGRDGKRYPLGSFVNEAKRDFGNVELDLTEAEAHHFVDAFIDTEPNRLEKTFRDKLFRQTQGHPLFTIELLRGMQEQGMLVKDEENMRIESQELVWDALPARDDPPGMGPSGAGAEARRRGQIQEGLGAWRATGAGLALPYYLTPFAEAKIRMERADEGQDVLNKAFAIAQANEDGFLSQNSTDSEATGAFKSSKPSFP